MNRSGNKRVRLASLGYNRLFPPGYLKRYAAWKMHTPRPMHWYNALTVDDVGSSIAGLAMIPAMFVIGSLAAILADTSFAAEVFQPLSVSMLLWSSVATLSCAFALFLRTCWLAKTLELGDRISGFVQTTTKVRMPISKRVCRREFVIRFDFDGEIRDETFSVSEHEYASRPWLKRLTDGAPVTLAQSTDAWNWLLLLDIYCDTAKQTKRRITNR